MHTPLSSNLGWLEISGLTASLCDVSVSVVTSATSASVFLCPAEMEMDTWFHLATSTKDTDTQIYISGARRKCIKKDDGVTLDADKPLVPSLGAKVAPAKGKKVQPADISQPFAGEVDEVRLWISVRTETEITSNLFARLDGKLKDQIGPFGFQKDCSAARKDKCLGNRLADLSGQLGNAAAVCFAHYDLVRGKVTVSLFSDVDYEGAAYGILATKPIAGRAC